MVYAYQRERRIEAINLVLVKHSSGFDLMEFVRTGNLPKQEPVRVSPETQVAVERKITEFYATGKLIVDGE